MGWIGKWPAHLLLHPLEPNLSNFLEKGCARFDIKSEMEIDANMGSDQRNLM